MTNTDVLVHETRVRTRLGWLHSRTPLATRLEHMFGVAARIDHRVRADFTTQVKPARTRCSWNDYPYRYAIDWIAENDDDAESVGTVSVWPDRTPLGPGAEVLRFRLAKPTSAVLAEFAGLPVDERRFLLTHDFYTMDRWTLSFESADYLLDVEFRYEPIG